MMVAMLNDRIKAAVDEKKQALADFSAGKASRQRAMRVLDVDYSELLDLMAKNRLPIPELSDAQATDAGHEMNLFLQGMGI
jgi:hypothetical protein